MGRKYSTSWSMPKKKSWTRQADHTARTRTMDSGIIASSPLKYSHTRKTMNVPPAPQKSPITVALSQANWFPPQTRARKNWIAAGANRAKPTRSSFVRMVFRTESSRGLMLSGMSMKRSKMATRPPMGRLM